MIIEHAMACVTGAIMGMDTTLYREFPDLFTREWLLDRIEELQRQYAKATEEKPTP